MKPIKFIFKMIENNRLLITLIMLIFCFIMLAWSYHIHEDTKKFNKKNSEYINRIKNMIDFSIMIEDPYRSYILEPWYEKIDQMWDYDNVNILIEHSTIKNKLYITIIKHDK